MEKRESFIVYKSFYGLFKLLPDTDRLKMFEAVFEYGFNGDIPSFDNCTAQAIWDAIYPQLRANNARWENGCKGGAPKGNQNAKKAEKVAEKTTETINKNKEEKQPKNNQKTTNGVDEKTTEKQPNENENENENENVITSSNDDDKSAPAREVVLSSSSSSSSFGLPDWVEVDCDPNEIADLERLIEKIEKSEYLRSWKFLSRYAAKADKILSGYYDTFLVPPKKSASSKDAQGYMTHDYTEEQLKGAFLNWGASGEG